MIAPMNGNTAIRTCQIHSGAETGCFNMALDETLLDWLRLEETAPTLIVRTYQWRVPTLSGGVHQSDEEVEELLERYSMEGTEILDRVRRPTGGRAILHGEDISFSFVTNVPDVLKMPLMDSYFFFTAFLKTALRDCGVAVSDSGELRRRAYMLSSVCFETKTPSDVVDARGRKIAGCAQLRRDGGILQHGAAFLDPYAVSAPDFSNALFRAVARYYGKTALPEFPARDNPAFVQMLLERMDAYNRESAGTLTRASTTAGSHLTPASC